MNLDHIISPFSRVVKWFNKPLPSFYVFPHHDNYLSGWGKPYVDNLDNPLPEPGTPAGPDPLRKFGYDADTTSWEAKREPGDWVYGNIDWRGPLLAGQGHPDFTLKLSYHGPQTRYFASTNFIYGSESKHNEIYVRGSYADIAPHPVLGAAYWDYTDPQTTITTEYIVVICKVGLEDRVYIREKRDPVGPKVMTSSIRAERMEVYDPLLKLDGWREILNIGVQTYTGETATEPRTPWFFSQDGSEAQCMRNTLKTFNNGVTSVTEEGMFRYKIKLSTPTVATFTNLRNTSGYTYTFDTTKTSYPHIYARLQFFDRDDTYPACEMCEVAATIGCGEASPRPTEHYFAVDHIDQEVDQTGAYVVAIDYYQNDEIVVYCKHDMYRNYEKYWRFNIDTVVGQQQNETYLYASPRGACTYGNDYWESALDGLRLNYWNWYDAGGNWDASVECYACQQNKTVDQYIDDGGAVPPDTTFNAFHMTPSYNVDDNIWLEWTHPAITTGPQKVYVHSAGQDLRDLTTSGGTDVGDIINNRVTFTAWLHHLDVRLKQGPFAVARTETIWRRNIGNYLEYHDPNNPSFPTRDSSDDMDWFKKPVISDQEEKTEYQLIDPFDDPSKFQPLAVEQGATGLQTIDAEEPMRRDDMIAWNPTGAANSSHQPQASSTELGFDWRRKNFTWTYTIISVDGHFPTITDLDNETLEPHCDDWVHEAGSLSALGKNQWYTHSQLFSSSKNVSDGGFAWQDGTAVCVSMRYEKGKDASGNPLPRPVTFPSTLTDVYYWNYISHGVMENIMTVDPIFDKPDRFYPIGVE